jgi:PAS domain S-box-containing protein
MTQSLLLNLAIILAAAYLISVFIHEPHPGQSGPRLRDLSIAPIFAITTLLLMTYPAVTPFGATMDARAAPVVLAGVFGGPISAALSVAMGSAARMVMAGPYVTGGIASMVCYGVLGLLMRRQITADQPAMRRYLMLLFTALGSVVCVLPTFFMDATTAQSIQNLKFIFPYLLAQNVVGIMLFGSSILRIDRVARAAAVASTLRTALKRASNGVLILEGRDNPVVIYANEGAAAVFDLTPATIARRAWAKIVNSDTSDPDVLALEAAMAKGLPQVAEFWMNSPTAGRILVKVTLTPVEIHNARPQRFILILDDVTREREQARLLQVVTEHIPLLVAYFDRELRCRYSNGAYNRFFKRQPHEVLGKHLQDIVGAANFVLILPSVEAALAGQGSERRIELDFEEAGGRRVMRESLFPQIDPGRNEVVGYVAMVEDITEQVRSEETLRRNEKLSAIGTLTGNLAHDFNNLNAVIIGNLELAQLETRAARHKGYMASALDAAERAATLTQKLLSFARQAPLRPEIVDLNTELAAHARFLEVSLLPRPRLQITTAPDLPPISVDRDGLLTALLNLVINARDASSEGGSVTIRATRCVIPETTDLQDKAWSGDLDKVPAGDYACIEVIDTGEGVRPEHRQRILDPFFTTKPFGISAGLGLSITYGFVRQSQGLMRIGDNEPHGTRVTLLFPAAPDIAPASVDPAQGAVRFEGRKRQVWLLEDQPDLRDILSSHLRSFDLSVKVFYSADEVATAIDQGLSPDLLVADLVDPGNLRKASVVGKVRERLPFMPIVIVTGYPAHQIGDLLMDSDDVHILQKPATRAALLNVLAATDARLPR